MFIVSNIRQAVNGWRKNPIRMTAELIVSTVIGQAVFWRFGNDQIGVGMNPIWRTGIGPKLGKKVVSQVTVTPRLAKSLKIAEIVTDFARGPPEGLTYRRYGITPDVVCTTVTPPLWPTIEAAEKTISALLKPETVLTPEQVELCVANIYGNLFRYCQVAVIIVLHGQIDRFMTTPTEKFLRRLLCRP